MCVYRIKIKFFFLNADTREIASFNVHRIFFNVEADDRYLSRVSAISCTEGRATLRNWHMARGDEGNMYIKMHYEGPWWSKVTANE